MTNHSPDYGQASEPATKTDLTLKTFYGRVEDAADTHLRPFHKSTLLIDIN